jgi:riboflavin synthase
MSGHIHQTALIKEVLIIGDSKDLVIEVDPKWSKYIFEKGYVGINGCSITIGQVNETRFKVHLIPETLRSTNLDDLVFGDSINLELDQNTIAITDTTERILRDKS